VKLFNCYICFHIHTEPILVAYNDCKASYSRAIGSTESDPIDVDIPEFSDDNGEIR